MSSGGIPNSVNWGSTIVGFISFAFSLATAVRVFWDSINTIWDAPGEVPIFLVSLKQELYEEKEYLKRARRRERAELRSRSPSRARKGPGGGGGGGGGTRLSRTMTGTDAGGPVKAMNESLRRLMRQFRELERPFLSDPQLQQRREEDDFDDLEKYPDAGPRPGSEYACASMDLRRRMLWTWRKRQAVDMLNKLTRMQTRRITREVSDVLEIVQHLDRPRRRPSPARRPPSRPPSRPASRPVSRGPRETVYVPRRIVDDR